MNPEMALPDSLAKQIQSFEKRLCVMETIVAAFGGLLGICLTYSVLFLSDRIWNTPPWIRIPLSLLGGLIFAGFAYRWLRRWFWRRRDSRALARLIQKQYSRLGDRLLGAVELTESSTLPHNISPALCRAAIRQVADESARYDFKTAVDTRRSRFFSISFLLLFAVVLLSVLLFPQAGWNAWLRWIKPLAPIERYTFVRMEDMPDEQVTPHGEAFEIACRLASTSRRRPRHASCRFENQPRIKADVRSGTALFRIPGQTAPGTLRIRIGDATRKIRILPMFRPELKGLTAQVSLPAYLQSAPQSLTLKGGSAEFLSGSAIRFTGLASRELKSASLTVPAEQALAVQSNRFSSGVLRVDDLAACQFTWTDRFSLSCAEPHSLAVTAIADAPPLVECHGIAQTVAILQDEIIEINIRGEDDYGVNELWVVWEIAARAEDNASGRRETTPLGKGAPDVPIVAGAFVFSPLAFHIPEEATVSLVAYASDFFPGREPSRSPTIRIYVLSRAQHAKLVQRQMEALQSRIEDLAREEEKLLEQNLRLAELSAKKLASTKSEATLKKSEFTERLNTEHLKQLTGEGKNLLKEALRNRDIPKKALSQWAQMMRDMEQLAGGEMKQAADSLQQARKSSDQRSSKLDEAITLEEQILKTLRQTERGMNASLENMLARSFVNRFVKAASCEKEISESLLRQLHEIIGLFPDDLPADKSAMLAELTTRQEKTTEDVQYIQDDLAGFYTRTRLEPYDAVRQDMQNKKTVPAMKGLQEFVSRNISIQSIEQARHWEKQFNAWADFLRKKEGDAQGGKGQATQIDEADMELLITLLRARIREESLRDQTRLLEQIKETNRHYTADARKLSDIQNEVARDIRPLESLARNRVLKRLIDKIDGEMMNARVYLRRPQTDFKTIAIETEIIELLSDSISASSGRSGELAQMLMQAMGIQPRMGSGAGAMGGGSLAGGDTDKANVNTSGQSDGESRKRRQSDKTGGLDAGKIPEEFREVLEAYFDAWENRK